MKKSFSGGLDSLLDGSTSQPKKESQPMNETANDSPMPEGVVRSPAAKKTPVKITANSSIKGLKAGDTRATFILTAESLEKLKAVAYWERLNIKEIAQSAIDEYLNRYEKKTGTSIKPVP